MGGGSAAAGLSLPGVVAPVSIHEIKKKSNKQIKVNVKKNAKTNIVGADILPASTPGNLSDITDMNTLVADDISSLEKSLPQGCSLDELMRCSVQQPGDLRSVGPEKDQGVRSERRTHGGNKCKHTRGRDVTSDNLGKISL